MTVLFDAGALIAGERGDRDIRALIKREVQARRAPATHGGIVAEVWRDGRRQALLARLVSALQVIPLDERLGRRTGTLLGRAGQRDVNDAALIVLATDGDEILTSDTGDLRTLAEAADLHVDLVPV